MMISKLKKILFLAVFAFLGIYIISFINPSIFPLFFLNELLILTSLIALPVFAIFGFFIDKKAGIAFLVLILFFSPYYLSSYKFGNQKQGKIGELKIMNFNTSYFRCQSKSLEEYRSAEAKKVSNDMVQWIKSFDGDVMCFQEYYYDKHVETFTTTDQFHESGFTHHYISSNLPTAGFYSRSVATFSKLPIVNEGEIFIDSNLYNRGIFTDIKLQSDTIRVINVHLHSNELNKNTGVLRLIKTYVRNSVLRFHQAEAVLQNIQSSPHPVIVCGDFNQSIYSYIYRQLKSELNNSYEEKGNGFGATLNSETLFFLRIDQQFYTNDFELNTHEIKQEMKLSHHFPVECTYSLNTCD